MRDSIDFGISGLRLLVGVGQKAASHLLTCSSKRS